MNRKFLGLIVIIFGIILLLSNANLIDISIGSIIVNYWPVVLILAGLISILTNSASKTGGIIVLIIGVLFQLRVLGYFDIFDYLSFWPVVLILIGCWIIFSKGDSWNTNSKDSFSAFAMFSGSKIKSISQEFKGGSAVALFGGIDVDLRQANILHDHIATIDIFSAFGGCNIFVPQGWNVVIKGIPIFGGWGNKTVNTNPDGPLVKINCFVMFGGMDVKN